MTDSAPRFEMFNGNHDEVPDLNGTPAVERLARTASRLVKGVDLPLRRVRVQQGETVVELEWPKQDAASTEAPPRTEPPARTEATAPAEASGHPLHGSGTEPATEPATGSAGCVDGQPAAHHLVIAPMVGTFYHAREPGSPPFVEVGDLVEQGQDIGIVEAMKLMNPIQAERPGRVAAVLVENGQPVEYGEPLIALQPPEMTNEPA